MKYNQKISNILLATTLLFTMTACGGGSSSNSNMSSVKDSDGDGFYDGIDPAPNDATNPGDFSSPEKILANPKVKEALQAAENHGIVIRADLGHNPPNLTGYYRRSSLGVTVVTETGIDIGRKFLAKESRVRTEGDKYESASVYYDEKPLIFDYTKGSFLRGEGNQFTIYSPFKSTCTEGGSNYSTYGIWITSATRNSENGTLSNSNDVRINLTFSGTLTALCDARKIGGGKNKWDVIRFPSTNKIEDASDLNYMCVDDNKAYIPNETWKNSDKQSCKCTTDYEVECE